MSNQEKNQATLVIMAAGVGSRFGGGIKQLEPIGPEGEIIMDYSIYDAIEAGFTKVVFIIRKDIEADFKEVIGDRIAKKIEVAYAYQALEDIPSGYHHLLNGRSKPWGTGQAILAVKDIVNEPFAVINADDYYGKDAYIEAYQYLQSANGLYARDNRKVEEAAMVSFVLGNTLSDNGTVTRGVCKINAEGYLDAIEETFHIVKAGNGAVSLRDGEDAANVTSLAIAPERIMSLEMPVSMNMFCLFPSFFETLRTAFDTFLANVKPGDVKAEFLLPSIIGQSLQAGELMVKVLHSKDQWFGVTYKEDKEAVVASIKELIAKGFYPNMSSI